MSISPIDQLKNLCGLALAPAGAFLLFTLSDTRIDIMEWIFFSLLCALLATQVIQIAMASNRRAMLVEIVEMIRYEGEGIAGELKVIHKGLGKIEGRLTEPELQKNLQG